MKSIYKRADYLVTYRFPSGGDVKYNIRSSSPIGAECILRRHLTSQVFMKGEVVSIEECTTIEYRCTVELEDKPTQSSFLGGD